MKPLHIEVAAIHFREKQVRVGMCGRLTYSRRDCRYPLGGVTEANHRRYQ